MTNTTAILKMPLMNFNNNWKASLTINKMQIVDGEMTLCTTKYTIIMMANHLHSCQTKFKLIIFISFRIKELIINYLCLYAFNYFIGRHSIPCPSHARHVLPEAKRRRGDFSENPKGTDLAGLWGHGITFAQWNHRMRQMLLLEAVGKPPTPWQMN